MRDFPRLNWWTMLFTVISCIPGCIPNAYAQEDILAQCDLVYRQADPNEQKSMPARQLDLSDKPPRPQTRLPDFVSDHPQFAILPFEDPIAAPLLALDESKGTGTGYDKLYVDADNNADLLDDPVIDVQSQVKPEESTGGSFERLMTIEFGIIEISSSGTASDSYHFRFFLYASARESTYLRANVASAGVYEGQFTLSGHRCWITLTDTHMNGAFGETGGMHLRTTSFRLGDRIWLTEEPAAIEPSEPEIACDGERVYFGGKWLELRIQNGGKHAVVVDPHLPVGRIVFKDPPSELRICNEKGRITLSGSREAEVPADEYLMTNCEYMLPDKSASLEFLPGEESVRRQAKLEIRANETVKFPYGPPFVTSVQVPRVLADYGAMPDVAIRDRAGLPFRCWLGNLGRPDIVVRGQRGENVARLVYHRPDTDAVPPPYTWKPEPGQNGRFRLSCPLPMFPFKVKAKDTVIKCTWWPGSQNKVDFEIVDAPEP